MATAICDSGPCPECHAPAVFSNRTGLVCPICGLVIDETWFMEERSSNPAQNLPLPVGSYIRIEDAAEPLRGPLRRAFRFVNAHRGEFDQFASNYVAKRFDFSPNACSQILNLACEIHRGREWKNTFRSYWADFIDYFALIVARKSGIGLEIKTLFPHYQHKVNFLFKMRKLTGIEVPPDSPSNYLPGIINMLTEHIPSLNGGKIHVRALCFLAQKRVPGSITLAKAAVFACLPKRVTKMQFVCIMGMDLSALNCSLKKLGAYRPPQKRHPK